MGHSPGQKSPPKPPLSTDPGWRDAAWGRGRVEKARGGMAGRRWPMSGASSMTQRFSRSCMNTTEAGQGQGPRGPLLQQCPAHPTGCCSPAPEAGHKQEQTPNTHSPRDLEGKVSVKPILFIFLFQLVSWLCKSSGRVNRAGISSVRCLPSWGVTPGWWQTARPGARPRGGGCGGRGVVSGSACGCCPPGSPTATFRGRGGMQGEGCGEGHHIWLGIPPPLPNQRWATMSPFLPQNPRPGGVLGPGGRMGLGGAAALAPPGEPGCGADNPPGDSGGGWR